MAGPASDAGATGGAGANAGKDWECWICDQSIPVATLQEGFEHTKECERDRDREIARTKREARTLKKAATKGKTLAKELKARGD